MNKRIIAVLVVGLVASVYYYLETANAPQGGALRLYGNVDIREVQLGFRVGGRLESMTFEEGHAVAPGDLLAELESTPQHQALAVAEAQVSEARARLDLLTTGTRPQEVEQAEARVVEAEAALDNAEQELQRQSELLKQNMSSQRVVDNALSLRDQSSARLRAAQEALALAHEGFRAEDIAAAEAALGGAIARRDQAQTALDDTRLYAPNPGIIMTRVQEPGAMLAVGAPVYSLSLTDTVYIRAYVDEPRLGEVQPGNSVTVSTDGGAQSYKGQVGFVSPRAEFTPKTVETEELRTDLVYRVRIVVIDADARLRQGMPVTVRLD